MAPSAKSAFTSVARIRRPRSAVCSKYSYMRTILVNRWEQGEVTKRIGSLQHQAQGRPPLDFFNLPTHERCAPSQASAIPTEKGELPRFQAPFENRFVQRQRNGTGRCVAVLLQVVVNLRSRNVQDVASRVDDPDVRLMREVEIDVLGRQLGVGKNVLDRVAQDGHGPFEDGPAVHEHVVQALVEVFATWRVAAAAGR